MNEITKVKYVKWNQEFEDTYFYQGEDLGVIYTRDFTKFRLWAPTAQSVMVNLYRQGIGDNLIETTPLVKADKGTWIAQINRDLDKVYYTYSVTVDGITREAIDPYAKAAGVNGLRGMVIDMEKTNPLHWEVDRKPEFKTIEDAVIYELHVRDLSIDSSSGILEKGKYLGLTQTGTKNIDGLSTGLDHIKELGITHLHLLPVYDYGTVDELRLDAPQFNWGYDPENYNVPEGSYATDPFHGEVRIKEFKQMVKTLHENGIRVVMDVVYNHTYATADSTFNKIVPGYYYRMDGEVFTNGSGCGNETASERVMVRKYIMDSVLYWAKEYHIDGFRFDLMQVHDMETMRQIEKSLHELDPSIILYGEGWKGGDSALDETTSAKKENASQLEGISFFNDDIRDGIKGHVFSFNEPGFVNGGKKMEEEIRFGVVGAIAHKGVKKKPWAISPSQSVNYVSAHDDLSLWDKLATTNPNDSIEDRIRMNKLAAAIVFTSQGVPFLQAGEEILRTKPSEETGKLFEENSFRSSDFVNSIKWNMKKEHMEIFEYYKGLIAFRKEHPALRMRTAQEVNQFLRFLKWQKRNVVSYIIEKPTTEEKSEKLCVIHNANRKSVMVSIPRGNWKIYINGKQAGTKVIREFTGNKVQVEPIATLVMCQEK